MIEETMIETAIGFLSRIIEYGGPFLLVIGLLVVIHEYGHFWVARRCGVKVETFSVGFGPEIMGWRDRSGTRWRIAVIPLGGYVRMLGDADGSSRPAEEELAALTEKERNQSFYYKKLPARAAIVAAGPIANFLLAIALFSGHASLIGQNYREPIIDAVVKNSAAEEAGLKPGDRILELNGKKISSFREVQIFFHIHLDAPVTLTIERDGIVDTFPVRARLGAQDSKYGRTDFGVLGIHNNQKPTMRKLNPIDAVSFGVRHTFELGSFMLRAIGQLVSGKRSIDEMGGPIRIAQISKQVVNDGGAKSLILLMAALSVSLGLINLLPIPVLDGGHLFFFLVEALGGRPLSHRLQNFAYPIGFVLIAGLMILLTFNDLFLALRP